MTVVSPLRRPLTQTERVRRFIEDNPGCTVLDMARGLEPFVSNPRARISDVRAELEREGGHYDVVCEKRDGAGHFYIRSTGPVQLAAFPD